MHFCTPRRVFAHAHYKLEFDDAKSLPGRLDDNHTQKFSYYVHIKKIRSKTKIALAVELSIFSIFGEQGKKPIYFRGTREQVPPWESLITYLTKFFSLFSRIFAEFEIRFERQSKPNIPSFFLSLDTKSINFDHHLRCGGWLN